MSGRIVGGFVLVFKFGGPGPLSLDERSSALICSLQSIFNDLEELIIWKYWVSSIYVWVSSLNFEPRKTTGNVQAYGIVNRRYNQPEIRVSSE